MRTEEKPSVYARAEVGSRQIVLQLGLGVLAFIVGSILSVGASARIGERIGPLDSDWAVIGFYWVFERLWLVAVLPLFGYVVGRFTQMKASRFALTSALSGEIFSVLLVTAINGFEFLMEDIGALVGRGVTLLFGVAITAGAVRVGRGGAAQSAQEAAEVIAEARKAEYAAFLAAAPEGRGSSPLPRGGEGDR